MQTSSFHLPPELQTELFGDSYNSFGFSHNSLPEPQEFIINLSRYLPGVNELVTSNEKWASDPFWIFESPVEYVARAVQKLKVAIDRVPFFASEQSIINLFTNFTNEIMPSEIGDLADSFRNHLRDFPLFQDLVRQREDIVESYRRHMEEYLDNLLPIISKYVRTNEGAPPKFERINWLLDWNVENLTARQIVEKYNLSDESTVRKALADFKAYNLPVKEKVGKAMNWNDDWFLNRLKAGFPDRKKLIKSSSEKV